MLKGILKSNKTCYSRNNSRKYLLVAVSVCLNEVNFIKLKYSAEEIPWSGFNTFTLAQLLLLLLTA